MAKFFADNNTLPLGRKLQNFNYFTSKIRLTFVAQGAPMLYGKMIIYADPRPVDPGRTIPASVMPALPQKCRSQLIPHVVIDPSQTKTYELILDCPTIYGLWSKKLNLGSYLCGYQIINPLAIGSQGTAPAVSITVYMALVDPKLSVATFTSSDLHASEIKNPSDHVDTFGKAMGVMSSLPIVGQGASVLSNMSGKAASVMRWFGFSKPFEDNRVNTGRFYTIPEQHTVDGKFFGQTLGFRMLNALGIGKFTSLDVEEDMIVENLCNRFAFIQDLSIPTASASGTAITTLPLSVNSIYLTDSPAIANGYEMSPLCQMCVPYVKVRCDFKFRIEFIGSVFHRATIVAAYFPDVADTALTVPLATALQTVKTWTFQVTGNAVYDLEIPWSSPYPFSELNGPTSYGTSLKTNATSNGNIGFYVLNPVISNSTNPLYMNVYMAGCNVMLGHPTNEDLLRFTPVFTSAPAELINPVCIQDATFYKRFFGEESPHTTKELCSRLTPQFRWRDDATSRSGNRVNIILPNRPFLYSGATSIPTSITPLMSLLTFTTNSYVGYRGSINWTVFPDSDDKQVVSTAQFVPWTLGTRIELLPQGVPISVIESVAPDSWNFEFVSTMNYVANAFQKFISFTYPYYYKGLFDSIYPVVSPVTDTSKNMFRTSIVLADNRLPTVPSHCTALFLHGAGDDLKFIKYRGMPTIIIAP